MPLVPETILDEILNRVDIVELISGYIPLKRAGRNFKALCPFHHEKTPSFMVSPQRQIYHCFGCKSGGNAFRFLMQYEHLDFREAIEMLASRAGVSLPRERMDSRGMGMRLSLYNIMELACGFYQQVLNSAAGHRARDYLLKRNVKEQTQSLFKVGLSPTQWDGLLNYLRSKHVSLSLMEKAGLILSRQETDGYHDRFRQRIIFPITDIKSRVIAFGGRVLDESVPKYINSPQTPLYTKGSHLYGMDLAKKAVAEKDNIVIVEGYLDCIVPYQEGLHNIVATLGTALTVEQIKAIKRYTHNVSVVFDADQAGELATLRSLDMFIEEGLEVKIVALPVGFDPDSYVRKKGIKAFGDLINSALPLFNYKLNILKSHYGVKEPMGKAKICSQMLSTINKIKNAILRAEYLKALSEDMGIKEGILVSELKKVKQPRADFAMGQTIEVNAGINPVEKLLIRLMLQQTQVIPYLKDNLRPQDFRDRRACKIVSALFNLSHDVKHISVNGLLNHLEDEAACRLVSELTMLPQLPLEDKERVIQDCIRRLRQQRVQMRKEELLRDIRLAEKMGDKSQLDCLKKELVILIKEQKK
jgi:DNA primase